MVDTDANLLKIKHSSLELRTKPGASIHYSYVLGPDAGSAPLIVFLNGLMTDKASWLAIMAKMIQETPSYPTMLAYDRYGQGLTEDRDPQDQAREKGYGHDAQDVAMDLHQLILQFVDGHLDSHGKMPEMIFVAASIGCAIARLYAQAHPQSVAKLLFLDSIVANSNFDWWPNPDADDFDPRSLPEDITEDMLRGQRAAFAARFNPSVVNPESLDRRNLAKLLPHSDAPKLEGPDNGGPRIMVIGHDPVAFAEESFQTMGTPISLSMKYTNPLWHEYNTGLVNLTDPGRGTGPHIAPASGHFIQRDANLVVKSILVLMQETA